MYAIIQSRLKRYESGPSHLFGIASKSKDYTNLTGPIRGIKFADIAEPLKQLMGSEFEEVNVGFYLVLE